MNSISAMSLMQFLRIITELLVCRDYSALERLSKGRRLSASEMASAVADYGRTLKMPPDGMFLPDIISVIGSSVPKWSIVIPLCTVEEGASDLSIELLVSQGNLTGFEVEIGDIHVL